MELPDRIQLTEKRIRAACERSGRERDHVTLVAVTKTMSAEVINEAIRKGLTEIGENRVQEYLAKRDGLVSHRLHMIGHLQRNKVRQIIRHTVLIHSVDSVALAEEIQKRSADAGIQTAILLETNTSGEESKFGFNVEEIPEATEYIVGMPDVSLRGLMTVAEFVDDPEDLRPVFKMLEQTRREMQSAFPDQDFSELSMGMTNDYEVAIE